MRAQTEQPPRGIWYTKQSGIWQTVWLESVPNTYVTSLKITPLYDEARVSIKATTNKPCANVRVGLLSGKELVEASVLQNGEAVLDIPDFISWTPENPHLYDVVVVADEERVGSYFGMSKWSVGRDIDNIPRIMLNNEPFFFNGLLDQGYWSDGLYTAPSDDEIIFDIVTAKELGFNTLRKHIKIEPLRWYYHCDRLGMIVWQDLVAAAEANSKMVGVRSPSAGNMRDGAFPKRHSRLDPIGRQSYIDDLKETAALL